MKTDYFIHVEIEIKDNMVSPENIKEAISKIPKGYEVEDQDEKPQIEIKKNKANLLFRCRVIKITSSFSVKTGKNNLSKNSY